MVNSLLVMYLCSVHKGREGVDKNKAMISCGLALLSMLERIQVQLTKANTRGRGHVTARALCHNDSTEDAVLPLHVEGLCPLIVGERKESMVTVVLLLDVYSSDASICMSFS